MDSFLADHGVEPTRALEILKRARPFCDGSGMFPENKLDEVLRDFDLAWAFEALPRATPGMPKPAPRVVVWQICFRL